MTKDEIIDIDGEFKKEFGCENRFTNKQEGREKTKKERSVKKT